MGEQPLLSQQPIHGRFRGQVLTAFSQHRHHLIRTLVAVFRPIEHLEHLGTLALAELVGRARPRASAPVVQALALPALHRAHRHPQYRTRFALARAANHRLLEQLQRLGTL